MALIQTCPSDLVGLAVGVAGVVDEHGDAVPVDYLRSVTDSEEIGGGRVLVLYVGLLFGYARPGVFDDAGAILDWLGGVAAGGMDGGGADD